MTLIRFVQRASILAGITFAGVAFHGGSATAQTEKFCVVASNGNTTCGALQSVESGCVTAGNGTSACGKFKSAKKVQTQEREQEDKTPAQNSGYRKEVNGVTYLLRGCKPTDNIGDGFGFYVKCNLVLTVKRENQIGYIYSGSGSSSITDLAGNTYASGGLLYSGGRYGIYDIKMSPGIDYVVDIFFPTRDQITKLSLLNVIVTNKKILQFRNITVSN